MKRISILLLAATSFAVPACSSDGTSTGDDDGTDTGDGGTTQDEWNALLTSRTADFSAALRIAALRLTGDLPTLAEIKQVANAADDAARRTEYETVLHEYLRRPVFAKQMFSFWRDTFKMGGGATFDAKFDTAAALAAKLSATNGAYTDLFTKATLTCPTFDMATGTFNDVSCTNGGPTAGVLSNPGMNAVFFSNFAFRRTRWVQETFDCLRFPAEISTTDTEVGGAQPYRGVWPFTSIAGKANGGRVDFLDASSTVCANCHQTINHIAPLFANYDMTGAYKTTISVPTPLEGGPLAQLSDYLPATETTAWRYGKPATDLPALGAAIAADPDVAKCGVARIWNWALGKTDIVDTLQEVPIETIQSQVDAFTTNGFKMTDLIFAVYASDDFVKF